MKLLDGHPAMTGHIGAVPFMNDLMVALALDGVSPIIQGVVIDKDRSVPMTVRVGRRKRSSQVHVDALPVGP